jgi:hypothetical protein
MLYASYYRGGGRVVGGGGLIPCLFLCCATEKFRLISDGILLRQARQAGMIMNLKIRLQKNIYSPAKGLSKIRVNCRSNSHEDGIC